MSQENVERARERYELLSRAVRDGDFDGFVRDYVHPEVEWVPSPDSLGVQHGEAAVKARLAAMLEAIDEPRIEAQEFIDAGDEMVVAVRMSGRGKASGLEVDGRLFHVVSEKGGRLVRVAWYASRSEALKAVGPEE